MKYINKQLLKDALDYWKVFFLAKSLKQYKVGVVDNEQDLQQAKKLHAAVYLFRGFIDLSDIKEGMISHDADPHQGHAEYFVVKKDEEVIALARQIHYKGTGEHHESFPILKQSKLSANSIKKIISHHPHEIIEISALAKRRGEAAIVPLLLYKELWRYSTQKQHKLWVMACDVRLYHRLELLFGPSLQIIGEQTPYKGGDVIPVCIDLTHAIEYASSKRVSSGRGYFDLHKKAVKFIVGS